jgi:hypothetical protein
MRRAVYDREAEEIPVRRTDGARPAESVNARRHSAEPLTPVQPVGEFEEISFLRSFETFLPSFSEMFDRLWSNFELVTRPKAERLEILTGELKQHSGSLKEGRLDLVYYQNPGLNAGDPFPLWCHAARN